MKAQTLAPPSPLGVVFNAIRLFLSPLFLIISFTVGIILFLLTRKKIFIITPLIFSILYLLLLVSSYIFGV